MADDLSALGEDDLSRLLQVIESLEHSAFDFLQLEVGGMKVVLGKGDPATYLERLGGAGAAPAPPLGPPSPPPPSAPAPPSAPSSVGVPAAPSAPASAAASSAPASAPSPTLQTPTPTGAIEDGTVAITAPMMGMFYAQPEPGAPPYVSVGSRVDPDTTVALVEVMKMFNAVPAGVSGTVVAVLVENSQLVEYGQPMFLVRPG